jgi:tetratricopeptide (TPR) repeat protein
MRALSVFVMFALAANVASADPAAKKRADKLFEDGRKYLANGEYSLACTAFEESQVVDPAVGTQLNIALCYEKWGKLAMAYTVYLDAERAAREGKDKRSTVARKQAIALEPKLARLRVTLPDGIDRYAIYLLDAKEIDAAKLATELVLDPGAHVIEVRVAGAPPTKNEITLKPGQRAKLELELPAKPEVPAPVVEEKPAPVPEPTPPVATPTTTRSGPRLYGGIGLAVAGAATMGIASYIALDARSDYNAAKERCPDGMCPVLADFEATRDARDRARTMTWVFAGGAVVATVGTILILTSKRSAPSERITVTPTISERGAGLAIGGVL